MRPPPPSPLPKQRPAGQRRPAPPLHGGGNGGKGKGWKRPPAERRPRRGHGAETADRSNRVPTPRSRCVPAAPVPGCQLAAINDRPGRQSGRTLRGAVAEDAVGRGGGAVGSGHPALRDGAVRVSVRPAVRPEARDGAVGPSVRPTQATQGHHERLSARPSGQPPYPAPQPTSVCTGGGGEALPVRLSVRPPPSPVGAPGSVCPSPPRSVRPPAPLRPVRPRCRRAVAVAVAVRGSPGPPGPPVPPPGAAPPAAHLVRVVAQHGRDAAQPPAALPALLRPSARGRPQSRRQRHRRHRRRQPRRPARAHGDSGRRRRPAPAPASPRLLARPPRPIG